MRGSERELCSVERYGLQLVEPSRPEPRRVPPPVPATRSEAAVLRIGIVSFAAGYLAAITHLVLAGALGWLRIGAG